MPDPATANPAVPPPPASNPEGDRRPLTTTSPPTEQGASSSAIAPAAGSSCPPPKSPPSLPSSTSKAPPSVSGSRFTATSPPTTVSSGPGPAHGAASAASMPLNPNLPSHDAQLHVAEARAALVASMSNMLDSELQSRASLLHANAAVLSRQEQDVARATEALRRENDKLARVARDAGRKIKELGNVQNWAEVLERDFLVLEETMRLVRDDGGAESHGDEDSYSECSGSYWSGSESEGGEGDRRDAGSGSSRGSRKGSVDGLRVRRVDGQEDGKETKKGKGLSSSALHSGSSTAGGGSTPSSASRPTRSPSNVSSSATAIASLDEAILESLAEALATDMHVGPTSNGSDVA
ncbi:hypothetical protein F4802DRAFT_497250 [Xylaria palmicola]|nr:hypothetical protein F4802DRAFT_497250 [Xylaria palmicola]